MGKKDAIGSWCAKASACGRSWYVTRLNSRSLMGMEYLQTKCRPKGFKTEEAAGHEAARLNAALAKAEGAKP